MFLNILKISTSTVREMFLNIIVSIGCIHMDGLFSIRSNQPEIRIRFVELTGIPAG